MAKDTKQIHPDTTIGTVRLFVADLDRSLEYYQDGIGLKLHRRQEGRAKLGVGEDDLLDLVEQRNARPVQRGHTGLYHFALLVPSRIALARVLKHLINAQVPIGGSSDHAVSEALYLSDPDGHGIEIYRDRPRDMWPFANGQLQMTVDPLDGRGILAELDEVSDVWDGMAVGTTIGHIHLHVAHIDQTEEFYCNVLGFDVMQRYGDGASFMSAGGYHHHVGANTWAGVGAKPPPADAARLGSFAIRLPDANALDEVLARVRANEIPVEEGDAGWNVHDPARNQIVLTTG